jgi:hypothetical protein
MALDAAWSLFETHLFDAPSTAELFNPYRDRHGAHDRAEAPAIRRDNLRRYLACYDRRPPLFFLAEAPGPWGCRFSGVPLVSEAQLTDAAFPIDGRASSQEDVPHKEYSASIYWRVLEDAFPAFFTWNSVPLHPHPEGEPLSIRNPRRSEVRAWHDLLTGLLDVCAPDRVVAVGRKAERALQEVDVDCTYVRHPSQGGATKFEAGVREILDAMGLAVPTDQ